MKTKAIVLAAGRSSRMGVNKLLLIFDGKPVIEHILDTLAGFETIVVTGHRREDIKDTVRRRGAETVYNPEYDEGMTTSFKAGLRAVGADVDAVFMVLSDTFGFKPSILKKMITKMQSTDASLVSPIYEGKRGHPVLVSSKLFPEFINISENETMKDIMLRHEHQFVEGDMWTRIDLDTPEDYKRLKKLWANR